jgi:hypothetical protein
MRICVRGDELCSFLLCYVASLVYSSHCACVFEVVGCVPVVLCCLFYSPLIAHVCSRWWAVFLPVVLCCVSCIFLSLRMCVRGGGLCSFLLCYVACLVCSVSLLMCVRGGGLCFFLLCYVTPFIVLSLRMCVRGGGLCSFLLCYVACLV